MGASDELVVNSNTVQNSAIHTSAVGHGDTIVDSPFGAPVESQHLTGDINGSNDRIVSIPTTSNAPPSVAQMEADLQKLIAAGVVPSGNTATTNKPQP